MAFTQYLTLNEGGGERIGVLEQHRRHRCQLTVVPGRFLWDLVVPLALTRVSEWLHRV